MNHGPGAGGHGSGYDQRADHQRDGRAGDGLGPGRDHHGVVAGIGAQNGVDVQDGPRFLECELVEDYKRRKECYRQRWFGWWW